MLMLEFELTDAIKAFVKSFRVVRLRHLKRFFRDWNVGTYEYSIDYLLNKKFIHKHAEDIVAFYHPGKLPCSLATFNSCLCCLDAMTGTLASSEVIWFDHATFPVDIRFLTVDDEIYDMTYLDYSNWQAKYSLLEPAWAKGIPPGQEDPFNHIAVLTDLSLAQHFRELPFSQFIVVDGNGGIQGIYDND